MKKQLWVSLAVDLSVVATELMGLWIAARGMGASLFQYYTEDSNLLALLAFALSAIYTAREMKTGTRAPAWVGTFKYAATCCLAVTLLVVVFVLSQTPGMGGLGALLFHGSMLYHHLLCPVLAILSMALLQNRLPMRAAGYAMIPTVLYAAVSMSLNIARVMDGPYPFLHVYRQSVFASCAWAAGILGGAYLIALGLRRLTGIGKKK